MRSMEELKELLNDELDKIAREGELTAGSLDTIDKLTHSIKSIDTIMAMHGGSYENRSYARDRGSRSYQNRDSRGRYSRYSMDDDVEYRIREIMREIDDTSVKTALQKAIDKLEA